MTLTAFERIIRIRDRNKSLILSFRKSPQISRKALLFTITNVFVNHLFVYYLCVTQTNNRLKKI